MIDTATLDTLFMAARSHNGWLEDSIDDATLERLYALVRQGPTSANCCPM